MLVRLTSQSEFEILCASNATIEAAARALSVCPELDIHIPLRRACLCEDPEQVQRLFSIARLAAKECIVDWRWWTGRREGPVSWQMEEWMHRQGFVCELFPRFVEILQSRAAWSACCEGDLNRLQAICTDEHYVQLPPIGIHFTLFLLQVARDEHHRFSKGEYRQVLEWLMVRGLLTLDILHARHDAMFVCACSSFRPPVVEWLIAADPAWPWVEICVDNGTKPRMVRFVGEHVRWHRSELRKLWIGLVVRRARFSC